MNPFNWFLLWVALVGGTASGMILSNRLRVKAVRKKVLEDFIDAAFFMGLALLVAYGCLQYGFMGLRT